MILRCICFNTGNSKWSHFLCSAFHLSEHTSLLILSTPEGHRGCFRFMAITDEAPGTSLGVSLGYRTKIELLSHGCAHSCCFHTTRRRWDVLLFQVRPTLVINPFELFLLLDEGWKVSPTIAFICMVMITSRLNIFQMFFEHLGFFFCYLSFHIFKYFKLFFSFYHQLPCLFIIFLPYNFCLILILFLPYSLPLFLPVSSFHSLFRISLKTSKAFRIRLL